MIRLRFSFIALRSSAADTDRKKAEKEKKALGRKSCTDAMVFSSSFLFVLVAYLLPSVFPKALFILRNGRRGSSKMDENDLFREFAF